MHLKSTLDILLTDDPSADHILRPAFITLLLGEMQDSEALTLNSDVEGAAGSSVLVLGQAAVLSVSLRRDLYDLQHWQLIGGDGAHQLPVLQPGESWGRAALGATVQGQRVPL